VFVIDIIQASGLRIDRPSAWKIAPSARIYPIVLIHGILFLPTQLLPPIANQTGVPKHNRNGRFPFDLLPIVIIHLGALA
jgi:hypothetical protein